MIESIVNTLQLVMTGLCSCIALYNAVRLKDRAWVMLGLFSGIFFLGDLYWQLFLVFYDDTPQYYSVSELSWYTSYLFLLLLLIYVRVDICGHRMPGAGEPGGFFTGLKRLHPVLWCVPAFAAAMCVFYMQRGDLVSNIVAAILMTGLIWHALSGLMSLHEGSAELTGKQREGLKMLFWVVLLFCLAEYGMWTSSCFWMGDRITNIYFWFDILLSVTFLLFVPALRKAVGR